MFATILHVCNHTHKNSLLQVLYQFQDLDEDIANKQKYAAWRASEIRKVGSLPLHTVTSKVGSFLLHTM